MIVQVEESGAEWCPRSCINCHQPWPCPGSKKGARDWRGNPGLITPWRQWCSENLPRGADGCVVIDADSIVRIYDPRIPGDLGNATTMELKTFGATLSHATTMTYNCLSDPARNYFASLILVNGNVPSSVGHYPSLCECAGLPEQPVVAADILWNGVSVLAAELEKILTNPGDGP